MKTSEMTVEQVAAAVEPSKYKTMSLGECAKFDMENGLREKLSGWGRICKERFENRKSKRGVARRDRKG
jgi:hypothetical protein